ncbi:MAG: RDD family protein [Bryobacteraceae bacterium]|jgi:uncharacterized RDD family membrane protein YckC
MSAVHQQSRDRLLDRLLNIETPEGVVFSYELATPVARSLAWAVDAAAILTAIYFLGKLAAGLRPLNHDWEDAAAALLYFVAQVGYGIVLEWRWRGQTVGKRLFKLRVIDAQGLRLQLSQIVIRNLLRLIDSLPLLYLVGGTASLFSAKYQRLGDLAANTVVARERSWAEPDVEQLAPAKYNSLLAHPHLAARLRSKVGPEEVAIAVRAVSQRDGYEPRARVELFRELAGYFRELAPFPDAAVEGLTDEQYVRSVLRAIYN